MYLKSLSLKGFKSFADRSVLSLEPGVTAIVGPNGSGKSNISDAVLWVLGERNAKNLRGQVMEDVIFAGSSARKSVGVAEVELVLDNSDGALSVDYSEVSVTRRMFRNGESDYLINGTPARRMDVLDILHDCGMGTGTYSIISQGNLDSILQSKPEDRRALIEEAAGVLKHKQRKAKSERRIEQMEQHLERVQDIVSEVSRQLGPLERKAKKAAAYQDLSAELNDLSLQLAVDDVRVLQGKWDQICARIAFLEEDLEQKKLAIAEAEAASNRLQDMIRNGSESVAELARQHRAVSERVERFDSEVMLFQEKLRSSRLRGSELTASIASNAERRQQLTAENIELKNELADVSVKLAASQTETARAERAHAESSQELAALERDVFEHLQKRRDAEKAEQNVRNSHASTKEKLDMALSRARLFDERMAGLQENFNQAAAELAQVQSSTVSLDEQLEAATQGEAQSRSAFNAAKEAEKQARSKHDDAVKEERSIAAQMMALEQLERESLSSSSAARGWLDGDDAQAMFALSPLLHEINVDQGYEAVVERLLGTDISSLLVSDDSAVQSVFQAISKRDLTGMVTLLMRDDGVKRSAVSTGFKGDSLVSHIVCPAATESAVQALFGDVLVFSSLEEALAGHVEAPQCRCVTLDGAIVYSDGRVTFGRAAENSSEGALVRARRLDGLREAHRKAAVALEECSACVDEAAQVTKQCQDALLEAGQSLANIRGRVSAAKNEMAAAEKRHNQAKQELENAQRQREDVQRIIDSSTPLVQEFSEKLQDALALVEREKTLVAQCQDAVAPAREKESALAGTLADAKLKEAMFNERQVYLQRVIQTRDDELSKLDAADAAASEALFVQQRVERRALPLIAVFELLGASARKRASLLEEASNKEQESAVGMHEQAQAALNAVRAARDSYDAANEQVGEVRIEKGRLEVQVETSVAVIAREYALPLEKALELPELRDRAQVEEEVFRLKRRIANMGTINPDAASEYEELKVRYDYLTSQLADLHAARAALRKINAVIDERMKDDFARTFEQANANFKEIFTALFPGGTAELLLVDPSDMENTGVEVVAQPRGKKISKMTLMSGGEKSLVALALLFAVYRIRTTPFYILDEVEAALDDSNLRRLIAYLNELRQSTQLIMITHQRRTMEMADVLFGVSMQADGVTKVISQRLEHALQYAE